MVGVLHVVVSDHCWHTVSLLSRGVMRDCITPFEHTSARLRQRHCHMIPATWVSCTDRGVTRRDPPSDTVSRQVNEPEDDSARDCGRIDKGCCTVKRWSPGW